MEDNTGFSRGSTLLSTIGVILIDDYPNSSIECGHLERKISTKKTQRHIEHRTRIHRYHQSKPHCIANGTPFCKSAHVCQNGPPLIITVMLQIFQQFTIIMFYAPILFKTLGFGNGASLYDGLDLLVDKIGRRKLLLKACVQMFLSRMIIAITVGLKVQDNVDSLSHAMSILVVLMGCTFVSSLAWSFGSLGWLIPSETFPLETRLAGSSVTVCVDMMFVFSITHSFMPMLCAMKFEVFLFFYGRGVVMWLFVWFLMPKSKGISIEERLRRCGSNIRCGRNLWIMRLREMINYTQNVVRLNE